MAAGFKALNIESDNESDDEIDNTKEIQVEEALKLYQTALQFHAKGSDFYDDATRAYQDLFASDIFKYPESQAELQRIELYGAPDTDDLWDDLQPGLVATSDGLNTGPSTLAQILYLSHKNYAQFKLDALSAKFHAFNVTLNQLLADASAALNHFVQALDKDDTDFDLWRRTASVGHMLDSRRIARFCLEAVLDDDDAGLNGLMSLAGLDRSLAGEQLKALVSKLQDHLSVLQGSLSAGKRKMLSKVLKQKLNPYEDLLERQAALKEQALILPVPQRPDPVVLKAPATWAELGDALLRQLMAEQHGTSTIFSALTLSFELGDEPPLSTGVIEQPSAPLVLVPPPVSTVAYTTFPTTLNDQFPGLDGGQPTTQPRIASADPSMQVGDADIGTLPSRKRSGDAAGLGDGIEESRTKIRRTRARDSTADLGDVRQGRQAMIDENARWEVQQQLNEFQAIDDWAFATVGGLFEKIGIVGFAAAQHVRSEMKESRNCTPSEGIPSSMRDLKIARCDLQSFLDGCSEQLAHLLLQGGEAIDAGQSSDLGSTGTMFPGAATSKATTKAPPMPNDGLYELLRSINEDGHLTQEVAWRFIEALLRPGMLVIDASSYTRYQWSEALKTFVVRTLVNFDDTIYAQAVEELVAWRTAIADHTHKIAQYGLAEMMLSVLELHLDIYSLIKQPNSGVENDVVVAQGDRLQRWFDLAREFMQCRVIVDGDPNLKDELNLRFLWATTFNIGVCADVSQEHAINCMNDLRAILVSTDEPSIHLQNNAIMPELSVAALDREISKLTTRDFFLKVTSQDARDPASIIESLEPLLETLSTTKYDAEENVQIEPTDIVAAPPPELVRFLQGCDFSVRLLLWQRLRDAYASIDYKPKMVWCYLRMTSMVLNELKSPGVTTLTQQERQVTVLKCLRILQDTIKKMFDIVQSDVDALQCIDGNCLALAVTCFGEVLQLLQVFNVTEDNLRVAQSQPPSLSNSPPIQSSSTIMKLTHEMQVRIWAILYALLKEAISQNVDLYPAPLEDRFEFLRVVHRVLGIRGICGVLNRVFVRMLKDEFPKMRHIENYDSEMSQVLYDLYGLNCFHDPGADLMDHKCITDAFLDRSMPMQTVDLLLAQAKKLTINNLVKHPLRDTIEKVHGALPPKKRIVSEAMERNRQVYTAFLKSPINPVDVYRCADGQGNQLGVTLVPGDDASLAKKGWYFLMGHMCLTRFRSQKRSGAGPTEDIDIAIAFFRQDLDCSAENWETWFRLAQAYDAKIEESVVWSADKLNTTMPELVNLQRHAIHCYTMATAVANRSAESDKETFTKLAELYFDFGNRLYSSARAPFDMLPFDVAEHERFVSTSAGVQKKASFAPLRVYNVVKLANKMFQRSLDQKSENWIVHYMIGKCLWKMHAAEDRLRPTGERPSATQVIHALVRAVELLPEKDKNGKKEPVLEPDYKLVVVIHKLLTEKTTINLQQAKAALHHTKYARKEAFPQTMDGWGPYILAVLKNLRAADKSNWYHRMAHRSAQISHAYLGSEPDAQGQNRGALAAKHELTQQMFTKTMVLQVWRPDSERPGRHFVYTARYTRYFAEILEQLRDRAGLEQLARRVRRRQSDMYQHAVVWHEICAGYMRLLRNHAKLSEGLETSVFSNLPHDDFSQRKDSLEEWMQSKETGASHALDVLREVIELKRLNGTLMKPGALDDLIGDAYAELFNTVGKQLWEKERKEKEEAEEVARLKQDLDTTFDRPRHPSMDMNNLINNSVDGATEAQATHTVPPPPATNPSQPTTTEPAPTRRKIGVGRREIRTCAENCVQKTKTQPSANDIDRTLANAPRSQVLVERERPSLSGGASMENSPPGSVHDDADDESELSDLTESNSIGEPEPEPEAGPQTEVPPVFGGLATVNAGAGQKPEPEPEPEPEPLGDERDGSETAEEGAPEGADQDVEMRDGDNGDEDVVIVQETGNEEENKD